jgi:hypothetical protein
MARLCIFIPLLFGYVLFAQDKYPTKKQLQKALTKKTKLKGHIYNSTNWFTLESDSTYKEADTLVFYNNSKYQYGKHICHFVDWNFYKKDALWMQRVQLCKEPATATAIKDRDIFTFKIVDKRQPMVLEIYHKENLIEQFEVLALTSQQLDNRQNEITDVLTIRRIKTSDYFKPSANSSF